MIIVIVTAIVAIVAVVQRYDMARGYFVLLASEEADPNMRVAALVEGNAIDVLFAGDKARAQPAKMYLCNRTHEEKMAAVQFYTHVFRAAMEYQQQKHEACCCGCCGACWCCGKGAREEAEAKLHIAFQEMQKAGLM